MPRPRDQSATPLTPAARRDLRNIAKWSLREFGLDAAMRYGTLIAQALEDVIRDPNHPSSREHSDCLLPDIRTYHIELSRTRVSGARVRSPRHILVYRQVAESGVEILRILHDARILARALPAKYRVK